MSCNNVCVSIFLFYHLVGLLFSLVGLRYCNRATLKCYFFQSIPLLLLSLFFSLLSDIYPAVVIYLFSGYCIFIYLLWGIILFKIDRIKGSKFRALDNRPWKRTMVWCVGSPRLWLIGLPCFFLARGITTSFFFVRVVATTFLGMWDYDNSCLVCGVATTWLLLVCGVATTWLLLVCGITTTFVRCMGLPRPYVRMSFICVCPRLSVRRFITALCVLVCT